MKREIRENFRVVIEPRALGNWGWVRTSDRFMYDNDEKITKAYQDRCEEIEEQVKRHVDNIGRIDIEYDSKIVCIHCGYDWEEEENGEPMCCEKAQIEWKEATIKKE